MDSIQEITEEHLKYVETDDVESMKNLIDCASTKAINSTVSAWYGSLFGVACQQGAIRIVELMLDTDKVDVNNNRDDDFKVPPPFYCAAVYRHIDVCKKLIYHRRIKPEKIFIDGTIMDNLSDDECVALITYANNAGLLQKFCRDYRSSFLHCVCERDFEKSFHALKSFHQDMFVLNTYGKTPFHCACSWGATSIVQYYLDTYKDIVERTVPLDKSTPLHGACEWRRADIVKLLLGKPGDTKFDPLAVDEHGNTAVDLAFQSGDGDLNTIKEIYMHNIKIPDVKKSLCKLVRARHQSKMGLTDEKIKKLVDDYFSEVMYHRTYVDTYAYVNSYRYHYIGRYEPCPQCEFDQCTCENSEELRKCAANFESMKEAFNYICRVILQNY